MSTKKSETSDSSQRKNKMTKLSVIRGSRNNECQPTKINLSKNELAECIAMIGHNHHEIRKLIRQLRTEQNQEIRGSFFERLDRYCKVSCDRADKLFWSIEGID